MIIRLLNFAVGAVLGWIFGTIVGAILFISFIFYVAYYVHESDAHKAERLTNEAHWTKTQNEQSGHANGNGWYTAAGGNTWGLREGAPIKVQDGQAYDANGRLLGPIGP
jgi:hypothetical protein